MSLFQNLRGGALLAMKCCTRKDNLISPVIQLLVSYKSDLMTTYALDVQVLSKSAKPNVRKCLSIVNNELRDMKEQETIQFTSYRLWWNTFYSSLTLGH